MSKPQLKFVIPTAEQKQAADPAASVWVSANAGSGKTHVLVDRVVRLMLEGAAPETILCLTFTKAAAAEMQNRLFDRLSQWTLASDKELKGALTALGVKLRDGTLVKARQLFTRALETPGGLRIQTIHALAERLLRLFPVEAGVAPGFSVLEDLQKRELLQTAQQSLFRIAEAGGDPALSQALARVAEHANEQRFSELIAAFVKEFPALMHHLKGASSEHKIRNVLAACIALDPAATIDQAEDELCAIDVAAYDKMIDAFATLDPHSGFHVGERLRAVRDIPAGPQRLAQLRALTLSSKRELRKSVLSTENQRNLPDQFAMLQNEMQRVFELLEKRDLILRLDATAALYYVAQRITGLFLERKRAMGAFDFDDLILRAAHLLTGTARTQWVLKKLDGGITHILVDEAQDTNASQWAIIRALSLEFFAGEGREQQHQRSLFVVGDRKQSIYSFQGADARQYEDVHRYFDELISGAGQEFPRVPLKQSYRSVPEVLEAVDTVFKEGTYRDMGFATEEDRGHTSTRPEEHGAFELWPMLGDDKHDEPEAWGAPVDADWKGGHRRKLADAIAKQVKSWIENRMLPGADKKGNPKPVSAGDILILFRKRGALFANVIAALRKEKIEVAGADRLTLNESLTVHDLLALGQVMILPEDDHSLACILKSPFVPHALSEDQLITLAAERGDQLLMQRMAVSEDAEVQANHRALQDYKAYSHLGPFQFYSRILSQHRNTLLKRLGPEASDASDAFLEYCLQFEQQQGVSLAGFLAWFNQSIITLKREMDEAAGQVRLMTIHGAKGLEAPIVILADAAETGEAPGLPLVAVAGENHVQHPQEGLLYWNVSGLVESQKLEAWRNVAKLHDLEEKKRLLYVAMTRARDVLCIAGADKDAKPNKDSLYLYVLNAVTSATGRFKEGLHQVSSPLFPDPVMRYGVELERDRGAARAMNLQPSVKDWMKVPPKPDAGRRTRTLTGFISGTSNINADRRAEQGRALPSADAKRGTAIHVLLEALAAVPEDQRASLAVRKGGGLGLSVAEIDNLQAILVMPELQPFLSEDARSEAELYVAQGEDILTGRIDRMLIADDTIWLLDYKTTRKPPSTISEKDESVQQLALYAKALAEVFPDRAIKAALLFTETRALHWLTPELITRSCDEAMRAASQRAA